LKEGIQLNSEEKIKMGERIRILREAVGFSREQLAEMLDISVIFMRSIECGQRGFSIETLQKLCVVLSTSADYILFGESERNDHRQEILSSINEIPEVYLSLLMDGINQFKKMIALIQNTEQSSKIKKRPE